jgi:hypothetical protein
VACTRLVHSGHAVSMLQGWDSHLVDECNCVGPIFLEGVDHLDNQQDRIFAQDPFFLLIGIHPTVLDDAQADVNDVAIIHWVACRTCVCVCVCVCVFWPPVTTGVL